jgi:hypothetical protein
MEDKLLINGPVNVVRLEGYINNIKKIIYIYFDIHLPVTSQTQCIEYPNIDINNYLYNIFKNSTKQLDFFFETFKESRDKYLLKYKDRYIENVQKMFDIKKEKPFKYVRLHHIDVRNIFESKEIKIHLNEIDNLLENMNYQNVTIIKKLYNKINKEMIVIYDTIYNNKNKESILGKLINKMRNKYKNVHIKDKLNKYYDELQIIIKGFFETIKILNSLINDFLKNNDNIVKKRLIQVPEPYNKSYYTTSIDNSQKKEFLYHLHFIADLIDKFILSFFSRLMDIYYLRRLLDKDYITNIISYTGAAHSIFYIRILLQDFDFKITNTVYTKENNIEILNNKIKKLVKAEELFLIEDMLMPDQHYQCSDLTNFPKDFI